MNRKSKVPVHEIKLKNPQLTKQCRYSNAQTWRMTCRPATEAEITGNRLAQSWISSGSPHDVASLAQVWSHWGTHRLWFVCYYKWLFKKREVLGVPYWLKKHPSGPKPTNPVTLPRFLGGSKCGPSIACTNDAPFSKCMRVENGERSDDALVMLGTVDCGSLSTSRLIAMLPSWKSKSSKAPDHHG